MKQKKETDEARLLLQEELGLQLPESISGGEIIEKLAARVSELLQGDPGVFFQLMYRLDISEKKLDMAMREEDAPFAIAKLIFERQLQKIQSRQRFGRDNNAESDLKW